MALAQLGLPSYLAAKPGRLSSVVVRQLSRSKITSVFSAPDTTWITWKMKRSMIWPNRLPSNSIEQSYQPNKRHTKKNVHNKYMDLLDTGTVTMRTLLLYEHWKDMLCLYLNQAIVVRSVFPDFQHGDYKTEIIRNCPGVNFLFCDTDLLYFFRNRI